MHINYVGVLNVTNKRECDEFAAKKKETEKMERNREREKIYEVREEMKEESMRKREREQKKERTKTSHPGKKHCTSAAVNEYIDRNCKLHKLLLLTVQSSNKIRNGRITISIGSHPRQGQIRCISQGTTTITNSARRQKMSMHLRS